MRMMVALGFAAVAMAGTPAGAAGIGGRWINPDKSVIVEIKPCGRAQCGTVVWATAEAKAAARKGTPRLVGTRLLTGLTRDGGEWQGQLFVPDQNLRADAKITPQGANRIEVSGCKLMICKSQTWTRTNRAHG